MPHKLRDEKLEELSKVEGLEKLNEPVKTKKETVKAFQNSARFDFVTETYDPPVWDPKRDPYHYLDETKMVLGQRRSGKSELCQNVMLQMRKYYPRVYCFSATANNGFWQQIIPADMVISGLDEDVFLELIRINKERYKEHSQNIEEGELCGNPLIGVIMEDLLADKVMRESMSVRTTTLNGRHASLSMWVLTQGVTVLNPDERKSMDRYIIFRANDIETREFVRKTFGKAVLQLLDRVTAEPFQALVINNQTGAPKEAIFHKYKADIKLTKKLIRRNTVLGNDAAWEDVDIEEQKMDWPITHLAPRARLRKGFNLPVEKVEDPKAAADAKDEGPKVQKRRVASDDTEGTTTMFSWWN